MKMKEVEEQDLLEGFRVIREASRIIHFFFADDSVFFLKVDERKVRELVRIFI